ncbi:MULTISPECIES: serine hydrolase domain-containing protein [unclassified Marinovum]
MRLLAFCLSLLAAPLSAQDAATRVQEAFDLWIGAQGHPAAVLVLMQGDSEIAAIERGITADMPVELQSNSKAITALCVKSLVDQERLTWQTPLSTLLETNLDLTIADLITHTTGLTADATQALMPEWRGDGTPRWAEATVSALARTPKGPRGAFAYNNENYAILGTVIEVVTGEDYATACQTRVLSPAGVTTARLSAVTGSFGPWGGWEMSARDFARFHRYHFVGQDFTALPSAHIGDGAYYGLGMAGRTAGTGINRWNFGVLCFLGGPGDGGSFTVNWGATYSLFAAYSACVPGEAMAGLDRAMIEALSLDR